jgi:hypothetical protein
MDTELKGGMTVTTYSPPPGFDPLTADNADLVKAGFPARPDDPEHLARYNRVLGQLKGKLNYITPVLEVNEDVFHAPLKRLPGAGAQPSATASGTESSSNWSGGVVYAPSGQSFRWIEGDWVIPAVDPPTQDQPYYCASWIGIDGDRSDDVCQMGIGSSVSESGGVTRGSYNAWVEWYPLPEAPITNFPVNPGDMVTGLLCTAGAGATSATAYFSNRTTGATTSVTFRAPAGTALAGNCAEWIVEAPTVGGQQSAMADYGEVFFSVCDAVAYTANGQSSTTIGGGTGNNIDMHDSANAEVSAGSLTTATIVQCEYVGTLP